MSDSQTVQTSFEFKMVNGFIIVAYGNIKTCAEFNFYIDPEAAHIVLNSLSCPMIIVPLECGLEDAMMITKVWMLLIPTYLEN